MNKYRMKITLLSDLCVSDGGVYNSALDTDVCYDAYGFPFIPAKRLKGCLRECALELKDWGKDIPIGQLWGDKGDQRGSVRISNAHIENYENERQEIVEHAHAVLYHPQHILRKYTYVRTQTALDYERGVADETSLRTMRVVKKGNVFFSDVECEASLCEALHDCCRVLRHIGIARTRGLGEVKCTIEPADEGECPMSSAVLADGANKLWYTVDLEEPVIMKSAGGGETRTLDYIEGSKILGIVANRIKKKEDADLLQFLDQGSIQFSNAYITEGGERLLEVPGSFYSIKNEEAHFADMLYKSGHESETEGKQLNGMKHTYVRFDRTGALLTKDVETESRYHHRRPADKSIGRAYEEANGDSTFYQMSSIAAGQSFQGYVYGTPEQIKTVYGLLQDRDALIGYSRTAEYGKVTIRCVKTERVKAQSREGVRHFCIKLEAPAVIYGDNAMYSVSPEDLVREIAAELGISWEWLDHERTVYYLKYTDVGGYNVTWGARKPVITAFDKGTVVDLTLKSKKTVTIPASLTLGERRVEGYGEASFHPLEKEGRYVRSKSSEVKEQAAGILDVKGKKLAREICDDLFDSFVKLYAVRMTDELGVKEAIRPTVSNMLLMCSECDNIADVEKAVKARYDDKNISIKKEKGAYAGDILKRVKQKSRDCIPDFEKEYGITGFLREEGEEEIQMRLLKAFLISIKYALRKGDEQDV